MTENQSSYKQVIKATSLFGGVQVFNIIISVIRSKVIALFLGPAGMGIAGLFNTTLGLVGAVANFGLDTSAVKSISAAVNPQQAAREIAVLKRLVWMTGILGALLMLGSASWLSKLTFGTTDYTLAFVWISVTMLFKQLSSGQLAILQGLRKLEFLAKANLLGSAAGLLLTVPLYFYWRIEAIVPAIVITSLASLSFTWYYALKVQTPDVKISNAEALSEGKAMLRLGFSLSFITVITTLSAYVLQIFVNSTGGLQQVGFFNAGFAIINSYVGLVFTAMGTDYFPRLSAVSDDNAKVRVAVSEQAFIAVLIMTPIVVCFLCVAPLAVHILYSREFIPIVAMVNWGILGMLFKAVSWSMGYILIAKGDSRIFIKTSLGFNSAFLLINVLGYYWYGLEGLGITFLINYVIHFLVLKAIVGRRYAFYFDSEFRRIFALCLLCCGITFLFSYISFPFLRYGLMVAMAILSSVYCLHQLDKKVDIRETIRHKLKRK